MQLFKYIGQNVLPLCQQMLTLEVREKHPQLHTLYDWTSSTTLVLNEAANGCDCYPYDRFQGQSGKNQQLLLFARDGLGRGSTGDLCMYRVNDIRTMAVSRMLADMGKIFPEASPTLSQLKTMEVGCSCSLDWIICNGYLIT
jgi:hypothetical protein